MKTELIKVIPGLIAYADSKKNTLILEFAIPGAPTDTIDVKILKDCIHLTAPASSGFELASEIRNCRSDLREGIASN